MKLRIHGEQERGQALVEFALVLPVLALLLLAIYDFGCAIRVNNAISNMSREGANLASRYEYPPQDIMNALAVTAQPLNMQANGMIYITKVRGIKGSPTQIVSQDAWQNSAIKGTISSKIGTPTPSNPHPDAQNLGGLALDDGQMATVVETYYNYQSLFSTSAASLGRQFHSMSVFNGGI